MNNSSLNQFAEAVTSLDMSRSKFKRNFRHLTTINTGLLTPIYWSEVLPGDSVKMSIGSLLRMTTPLFPVMDNAYLDIHAYFVPNRLLWTHWEEFLGANKSTYWTQPTTYVPPMGLLGIDYAGSYSTPSKMKGTILDYLGLPVELVVGVGSGSGAKDIHQADLQVSTLPIRAYCLIWNEWYRDENVMQPVSVNLGDSHGDLNQSGTFLLGGSFVWSESNYSDYIANGDYVTAAEHGDHLLPVCKLHDMFTSALPAPQKGSAVGIGLAGALPIRNATSDEHNPLSQFSPAWYRTSGSPMTVTEFSDLHAYQNQTVGVPVSELDGTSVAHLDLRVDLSQASMITINALREAFAVQRFLEKQARGGSRYTEILQSFFGVTSSDASLQRPQYLGGRRVPINMTQVPQTSAQVSSGPVVGQLGAYSQTLDGAELFSKSFEEHGILMVMACVRTLHSYHQGVERKWQRTQLTDYYFPTFANLGEQPIFKRELAAIASPGYNSAVFGYREAWGEYRFEQNKISGGMRETPFLNYHYADQYGSAPALDRSFIREPQSNLSRTLSSTSVDHFLADFSFDAVWVRPMPVYSIPGLIDHH